MAEIIRGTTPTLEFKYNSIQISDITVANLYVKQQGVAIISKQIDTATVANSKISWTLTQTETLHLKPATSAAIVCDWKTNAGLRGRSEELLADVKEPGKAEEI